MNAPTSVLGDAVGQAFNDLRKTREGFAPGLEPREVGVILSVSTGIATVSGLPGIGSEELLRFPGGLLGIAFNLEEKEIGVVLLGDCTTLRTGDEVERTGRVCDIIVGDSLLGRVIDPLGEPLDDKGKDRCK